MILRVDHIWQTLIILSRGSADSPVSNPVGALMFRATVGSRAAMRALRKFIAFLGGRDYPASAQAAHVPPQGNRIRWETSL
mmetsp:Transcript_3493/g.8683  ORF Transcript_3493/g.8683 Transcript_3493/m.8683 type:complete len:81 (-) Transcript_3493:145-387(-)